MSAASNGANPIRRGFVLQRRDGSYTRAIAQKEDKVEMTGEIVEALRNGMFRIRLDNGHETLGYTAGRMRRFRIRMNPGDRVRIELSPYDLDRGRIVYRLRPGDDRPE
jgi:translation initiation factor IF-1